MLSRCAYAVVAALSLIQAAAKPAKSSAPVQVLETRRHEGSFGNDALWGLRRDLVKAGLEQRKSDNNVYKTNGTLDLSWSDATLYSTAYASLTIDGDLNLTQALSEFHSQFAPEVSNISSEVWQELDNWATYVWDNATETVESEVSQFFSDGDIDDFDICWGCYAFPSLDVDFNINITDIPETTLKLEFDDLELYMLLDASLEADETYKIDLYPKSWYQPAGIAIGDQMVGVVISLELILGLDAEMDVSTGVHVKFDDTLVLEIVLFGNDVSSITLPDGCFEFLPVKVSTSGIVLDATLRLGVTAGLNMSEDLGKTVKLGAGTSAFVYTDLAHFRTNITLPSTQLTSRDDDDNDCDMPVIESYEFGLGAEAGAFVQFMGEKWGPTPNSSIQVFYTTLFSACAISPATTTSTAIAGIQTAPALLADRDDLTTTAVSTTFTITNVLCKVASLRNCPASLQTTIQVTSASTLDVIVSKAEQALFPATTSSSVSTVPFGNGVQKVKASSGSPVSYVPPTTASTSGGDSSSTGGVSGIIGDAKKHYGGLSEKDKKLVIGLCAGLGGALLAATAAGIWFCLNKRKAKEQSVTGSNMEDAQGSDPSQPFLGESEPKAKWHQPQVNITDAGPPTPRAEE
ncbi:hypothetical protein VP1G_07502 [Cytospora mali]|uniref:Mid2 domain-containing protein n=1 Tax=Cytospora mali TaxID=578113 RepID=A0A194V8M4_CYTMA|nr:hypothetical protein VP1G_07502 [Valsa mali var. pyri (nom. inval.)]